MNILEKDFAPYEPSLALKELGFAEPCFGYYSEGELILNSHTNNHMQRFRYSAPTFSQAFRWFRDEYNWQHSIEPTADQHNHQLGYNYWIWNYKSGEEHYTMPKNKPTGDWKFKTYEEAELACLRKLIEIVKNKQ